MPVISELAEAGMMVSVDTTRSRIAEAALAAGAVMVNDVSGGQSDPNMVRVVRDGACPWVLTHNRGPSRTMQCRAHYDDVVGEVRDKLSARVDTKLALGVLAEAIIVDPGHGFAKKAAHNWSLLGRLDSIQSLGFPVLIGASRKSFLGSLLTDRDGGADRWPNATTPPRPSRHMPRWPEHGACGLTRCAVMPTRR
jgi:dihydropteroate synthase